jgi:hypothetical protein
VEPGAATCHPDAHGLGRQEPDEVVREVFNLQDLQGSQFVGTGSARLSTGREDASGGLWSREPLHAITTGRSMLRPSYPPSGVVTTNVTPQGSGYDTGGTATPWLHLAMLEELLQATVEPSYPPGGVTGQRDPPGKEGKEEEPLHPSRETFGARRCCCKPLWGRHTRPGVLQVNVTPQGRKEKRRNRYTRKMRPVEPLRHWKAREVITSQHDATEVVGSQRGTVGDHPDAKGGSRGP